MPYDPKTIEPRWQRYWEENQTFKTEDDTSRPKYYVLDMKASRRCSATGLEDRKALK